MESVEKAQEDRDQITKGEENLAQQNVTRGKGLETVPEQLRNQRSGLKLRVVDFFKILTSNVQKNKN